MDVLADSYPLMVVELRERVTGGFLRINRRAHAEVECAACRSTECLPYDRVQQWASSHHDPFIVGVIAEDGSYWRATGRAA